MEQCLSADCLEYEKLANTKKTTVKKQLPYLSQWSKEMFCTVISNSSCLSEAVIITLYIPSDNSDKLCQQLEI